MKVLNDWDRVQANTGEYESMTPGGHICKIIGARGEISKNGNEMLVLALEIADDSPLKGFYARQFERRKSSNNGGETKWPCRYFQLTQDKDGNTSPNYKGLIKSIEESNNGYKWNFNEATLKGLQVGFVFREEEYENMNGEIKTIVKPAWPRSTQTIRDGVEVPPKKPLAPRQAYAAPQNGFVPVADEDLPF